MEDSLFRRGGRGGATAGEGAKGDKGAGANVSFREEVAGEGCDVGVFTCLGALYTAAGDALRVLQAQEKKCVVYVGWQEVGSTPLACAGAR